tara:strand:- start:62 stop:235 length:174 start_codon:yes stop_codon:yes gene_type:complete
MNREEKKAHIEQIKSITNLLDYFTQQLGINTFHAQREIAKIESQIINLYQKDNNNEQ